MYTLGRAQLVQDGKGLEAAKETERASFSTIPCKLKWGVPGQIWRLSGGTVLSTAFLLDGVMGAIYQTVLKSSHITCFNKYLMKLMSVPENRIVWIWAAYCWS